MTGTASEAGGELRATYDLGVLRIPTNRPLLRKSLGNRTFLTSEAKWQRVVERADELSRMGRSVLVGTRSIADSENVSERLKDAGLSHVILNARQDMNEAEIVGQAGQPGRITVATNMAGRGTDIDLHSSVRKAGGLHVILTEYHESGRVDRQLFGRAGRQGDPGSFESLVSLDDELFIRYARNISVALRSLKFAGEMSSRVLQLMLRSYCQFLAERANARARRNAFAEDERFQREAIFAGRPE